MKREGWISREEKRGRELIEDRYTRDRKEKKKEKKEKQVREERKGRKKRELDR